MKLTSLIIIFLLFNFVSVFSDENIDFVKWKKNFKKIALQNNISEKTFDKNLTSAMTVSKVFSEILFDKATFLKFSFQVKNPDGFSDNEGVKNKNININE